MVQHSNKKCSFQQHLDFMICFYFFYEHANNFASKWTEILNSVWDITSSPVSLISIATNIVTIKLGFSYK